MPLHVKVLIDILQRRTESVVGKHIGERDIWRRSELEISVRLMKRNVLPYSFEHIADSKAEEKTKELGENCLT